MGYILAIDYGMRFIGLSIASSTLRVAIPLKEIDRKGLNDDQLADKILEIAKKRGKLEQIIIGLPQHMDSNESALSLAARKFAQAFSKKTDTPLKLMDERLTSKMAHVLLKEKEYSRSQRTEVINSVSATILLQNYLEIHF